jgi:hypothetical protein
MPMEYHIYVVELPRSNHRVLIAFQAFFQCY